MTFPFEALTSLSGTNITAKISLQLRFQGSFTMLWFGGQCLLLSASSFEQLPQLIQINAAFIWLQLCLPTFKSVCGGKTPSTTFQHNELKTGCKVWTAAIPSQWRHSLLWMTICSSFLLADALSRIFWSMVLAVTRRYTTTGFVCPMRWQRSWACRSACGFLRDDRSIKHGLNEICTRNSCCRFVISTNPVAVKDDDGVSSCQIDSQSSCSGAQQEDEHLWIFGKPGHLSETENDKNDSTIYSERQFGC